MNNATIETEASRVFFMTSSQLKIQTGPQKSRRIFLLTESVRRKRCTAAQVMCEFGPLFQTHVAFTNTWRGICVPYGKLFDWQMTRNRAARQFAGA